VGKEIRRNSAREVICQFAVGGSRLIPKKAGENLKKKGCCLKDWKQEAAKKRWLRVEGDGEVEKPLRGNGSSPLWRIERKKKGPGQWGKGAREIGRPQKTDKKRGWRRGGRLVLTKQASAVKPLEGHRVDKTQGKRRRAERGGPGKGWRKESSAVGQGLESSVPELSRRKLRGKVTALESSSRRGGG